jgi:hypothetical protein
MRKRTRRRSPGRRGRRTPPVRVRARSAAALFDPHAPIRETDSEDQAGAYGNDRGETDLPLT